MDLDVEKYVKGDVWLVNLPRSYYQLPIIRNRDLYESVPCMILSVSKDNKFVTLVAFSSTDKDTFDTISIKYSPYYPEHEAILTVSTNQLISRRGSIDTRSYINILQKVIVYITGTDIKFISKQISNKLETIPSMEVE